MARLGSDIKHPEGLFFPDTYIFTPGSTDYDLLRRAYQEGQRILDDTWAKRQADLPMATPYEALVMASIIENRPRTRPPARLGRVRQPPEDRHAAADRSHRDLRHGRRLPGPHPQARPADRHALEHLYPARPAAHADRGGRPRGAAGRGAAGTAQVPVLRVQGQRHQRILGQPERAQPQRVALHPGPGQQAQPSRPAQPARPAQPTEPAQPQSQQAAQPQSAPQSPAQQPAQPG